MNQNTGTNADKIERGRTREVDDMEDTKSKSKIQKKDEGDQTESLKETMDEGGD